LHPRHLLPPGNVLAVYDRITNKLQDYVPAEDHHLRRTCATESEKLPSIVPPPRSGRSPVNVFLVALNAEIKFRRFRSLQPPVPVAPNNDILIDRTNELVKLLYWKPSPSAGAVGKGTTISARRNPSRISQPKLGSLVETSEGERSSGSETVLSFRAVPTGLERQNKFAWLADVDLETRMAYGRSLMCGHDREYDPELFEDAIPIETIPPMFSGKTAIEDWRGGVPYE